MILAEREEILAAVSRREVIEAMREALVAHGRGQSDSPMPMHLNISEEEAEVHFKAGYRSGGKFFALKMASSFPGNARRGLAAGTGTVMLWSAVNGETMAVLKDDGALTDLRTAAVAALMAKELGRKDTTMGVLGTGVQARWQADIHAGVFDLKEVWVWGRNTERAEDCRRDIAERLPSSQVRVAASPQDLAVRTKLIVTATPARSPLLRAEDLQAGALISAVGADSPGKQELDPGILEAAELLLVDSLQQCLQLGELQHAPHLASRAIEMGRFCEGHGAKSAGDGITVADFTGLGIEDLFIAELCYEKLLRQREQVRQDSWPTNA
jgi:ornithine cyclodeaminase